MHSLPGKPDMLMSNFTVPPVRGTVSFCSVSVMLGVGKDGFVVVVVEGGLVVVVVGGGLLRTM